MPPPLSIESYSNLLKCRIKEVVEDHSLRSLISIYQVQDLAFVFHRDILEKRYNNCFGMMHVYFTRFHLQCGRFVNVDCHLHIPFSATCIECYPSRIWFFILEVKGNMEKLLNDKKQYQICRKMIPMKCSLECWNYFCSRMRNSDAIFFHFNRKHTDKLLHGDLSLSSSSTKKQLQLIRIDSVGSLKCAQSLFGITFGIGTRNRPPNKGENSVTIHHRDAVNLVDIPAANGGIALNRFAEFVSTPGIDFIYETSTRALKIRVRYNGFLAEEASIAAALNLSTAELPIHANEAHHLNVTLGTLFMREGSIVEVIGINGNEVLINDEESGMQ
jgi:hypothetical protein